MRILITAGPTHEPIDAVRYIGNRSSGRMGAALAGAAVAAGHKTTLIVGPVSIAMPSGVHRIDVETAAQMHAAVLAQFPSHDLLIMAAAVADFRPKHVSRGKISREARHDAGGTALRESAVLTQAGRPGTSRDTEHSLFIECEPTEDIVAAAALTKRADQRIIGFSLESEGGLQRAGEKLRRKKLDLMVYNPIETMNSASVGAVLLYADGKTEPLPMRSKADFAKLLIARAWQMFTDE